MFIHCDEEGNVLEEPVKSGYIDVDEESIFRIKREQYQQAQERVLFDVEIAQATINRLENYYQKQIK